MDSIYLMPLGLFIVCFSQAYVLAQKTSSAYIRAEDLAVELKNYAVNLEKIVQDRTHEIQEQKEEIGLQKESIELKAEELRTSNDNLRELADFKKNMTNMMIHDLKNPISNIIGFASLPGNIDKYKEHIHASGWKMLNMIQNMLDIEKHETSEIKLNIKGIDLQKLVNEALENTRYMVESSELHFRNNVKDGINIQVDETMINRVLSNIFSNAAKYAKQDGIVKVSSEKIVSEDQEEFIKVNIFNDGEAIPENQLDTIFKKYSQASSSKEKKYHSSGIGLAFCKLAINAHGGKIGAVNEDEIGVTFWFTLPLTKPDSN